MSNLFFAPISLFRWLTTNVVTLFCSSIDNIPDIPRWSRPSKNSSRHNRFNPPVLELILISFWSVMIPAVLILFLCPPENLLYLFQLPLFLLIRTSIFSLTLPVFNTLYPLILTNRLVLNLLRLKLTYPSTLDRTLLTRYVLKPDIPKLIFQNIYFSLSS